MGDASITKVSARTAPVGQMGQKYLAAGVRLSMRLWENEPPGPRQPLTRRPYEVIGFCIRGTARLHLEGQLILLSPGDCWVIPKGAEHAYEVVETFTAVEATTPPAEVHGRDQPVGLKASEVLPKSVLRETSPV